MGWSQPVRAATQSVTLFAAASLGEAMKEITLALGNQHPELQLRLSLAASSTLARQILAGAPADLFISADQAWMDHLAAHDLIEPDSRTNLLGNRLVLIGTPAMVERYREAKAVGWDAPLRLLLDEGERLAVGDPNHVPAGRYAKAALKTLGLWDYAEPRLAPAQDVRGAVALVARGAAPLGIAYATDAKGRSGIEIIDEIPASSYPTIRYPMAHTTGGPASNDAVGKVTAFLEGETAWSVFAGFGFEQPTSEGDE
ncbi:MAG: molybdate ABC transporter substrate-binding protein [Alphaproteobacteria bacterium]|nr:molybdate ABC transporter substrate-binding protein [Alphaproteobacteria bacterium SS10]